MEQQSELVASDDSMVTADERPIRFPVTRRTALLGLVSLGLMSGAATAETGGPRWNRDVNANGAALEQLGSLSMAANSTPIVDFAGDGLVIDDGVLTASDEATPLTVRDSDTAVADVEEIHFDENLTITDAGDGTVSVDSVDTRVNIQRGSLSVENVSRIALSSEFLVIRDGLDTVSVESGTWRRQTVNDDIVLVPLAHRVQLHSPTFQSVGVSAHLSSHQMLSNVTGGSVSRVIELDATAFDDFDGFEPATHSFTVQEAGTYHVSAAAEVFRSDTGLIVLEIRRNGHPVALYTDSITAGQRTLSLSKLVKLNTNDSISLALGMPAAVESATIAGGEPFTYLTMHKVA